MMMDEITLGSSVRKLHVSGAVLTETMHEGGMELPPHEHASANVNFVLRGTFGERVQGRELACTAGSLLVKPSGAAHSNRYGATRAHCVVVELKEESGGPGRALDDIWYSEDPEVAGIGWRLFREMLEPDVATPLEVEGLLAELRVRVGRGAVRERALEKAWATRPGWLGRVRERLDCAGDAPDVGELARDVAVHPRHLMRAFRRYHGCSVGEYLRRSRIRQAQRLLAETSLVLAAVASDAGFYDQSHFTRLVRRATGLAPSEYRRLVGRREPPLPPNLPQCDFEHPGRLGHTS
jgi:AraC family transcriptional regulator